MTQGRWSDALSWQPRGRVRRGAGPQGPLSAVRVPHYDSLPIPWLLPGTSQKSRLLDGGGSWGQSGRTRIAGLPPGRS